MRGLWDHEQPLSPSLLRSALRVLTGLLGFWALMGAIAGLWTISRGEFIGGFFTLATGLAMPFAIWLLARVLIDLLIVHNRSLDRMREVSETLDDIVPDEAVERPADVTVQPKRQGAALARARDDGPVYPAEE